jgi:hypothetical protein
MPIIVLLFLSIISGLPFLRNNQALDIEQTANLKAKKALCFTVNSNTLVLICISSSINILKAEH